MKTKIIKRDGSTEPFEPNKIRKVVTAAGLEKNESNILTDKVTKWVSKNKNPSVTTLEIREKVIEELKIVNPYVAGLFEWYEKTKDNNGQD